MCGRDRGTKTQPEKKVPRQRTHAKRLRRRTRAARASSAPSAKFNNRFFPSHNSPPPPSPRPSSATVVFVRPRARIRLNSEVNRRRHAITIIMLVNACRRGSSGIDITSRQPFAADRCDYAPRACNNTQNIWRACVTHKSLRSLALAPDHPENPPRPTDNYACARAPQHAFVSMRLLGAHVSRLLLLLLSLLC